MASETATIKNSLTGGHPLHTLISEHEFILNFLQELEDLDSFFQKSSSIGNNSEELRRLENVAEHLLGAEPHHQREEEVLFPEIEKRGILGPPEAMKQEHEKLRGYKKELKNIVKNFSETNIADFKKKLKETSENLVLMLREHISKENDILYPIALQVIPEENLWQEIKNKCDKIGYCCFTPSE